MKRAAILSFDRLKNDDKPLVNIIQILWNNDIVDIHRYAESTLEFTFEVQDEQQLDKKIIKVVSELEKVVFLRLAVTHSIRGKGNMKLDESLVDYIKQQVSFGALIRPKSLL